MRQLISGSFISLPASQRPILTPEFLVTIVAMLRAPAEPPPAFQASMTWLRLATCSPSCSLSEVCLPVAAAMDFKVWQHSHRISCSQPVDYREPLSASDIKSAVAFLGFRSPFQGVGLFLHFSQLELFGRQRKPSGRFPLAFKSQLIHPAVIAEWLMLTASAALTSI